MVGFGIAKVHPVAWREERHGADHTEANQCRGIERRIVVLVAYQWSIRLLRQGIVKLKLRFYVNDGLIV